MEQKRVKELAVTAAKVRLECLEAINACHSGHIGGALSAADILTVLYFEKMKNLDPENPKNPDRDRLVLSKGHCTGALYPVLALKGYFPVKDLKTFRHIDSYLSGHAEMKHVPGVDMSTGSLGQGLSAAAGMALAAKLDKKPYRVFAVMGDGEIEEGQIWEAAMAAAKYKLDNLVGFVDVNGLQIDGTTEEIMPSEPLDEKWEAFGWNVLKIDGHDLRAISDAVDAAGECSGKPTMILAKTVKGKGISFMENKVMWHGNTPDEEEYQKAKAELTARLLELEG
ncbi:transketolase [Caproiciproducens galactitolivorans]|uniref:Transketolase n=1 Tax=Caproiciproducens galactitolivorans TaxID=642589 RepID=A0ABT4BUZ9_9FIRM|nr:transketolase [Caproiciproducens galactitolivorans]MCY1714727.1 transketolase [Caproiciproducens galactitolivorans]